MQSFDEEENDFHPRMLVPIFGQKTRQRQGMIAEPPSSQFGSYHSSRQSGGRLSHSSGIFKRDGIREVMTNNNVDKQISTDPFQSDRARIFNYQGRNSRYQNCSDNERLKRTTSLLGLNDTMASNFVKGYANTLHSKAKENSETSTKFNPGNATDRTHDTKPKEKKDLKVNKENLPRQTTERYRVFTLDISAYKAWVKFKDELKALCEIYGKLDSTVSAAIHDVGKRFNIRDSSGTLACIFWEIDRPFPALRRGTMLRVMGKPDTANPDRFHCISIRPATKEELDMKESRHEESVSVIRNWTTSLREL